MISVASLVSFAAALISDVEPLQCAKLQHQSAATRRFITNVSVQGDLQVIKKELGESYQD